MRNAQRYLEIVKERGERRLPLRRVYRNLQNRELFLGAYARLYANAGALTPGTDPADTVDGMTLKRIDSIIAELRAGTYRWQPVRRTYIPKRNGGRRPLGMPGWRDKLLQEVLRMVLSAYYEPQFSEASHGFRVGRGCHSALQSITCSWQGTKWFIEGDIQGCFDHISHDRLLAIIERDIQDQRLLKLLRGMLEAGYNENWQYHQTYSGTPQGGVLSPLLANIFLHELDKYVEDRVIPQHTSGERRRRNPEYDRLTQGMRKAQKQGDSAGYRALAKQRRQIPSCDPDDPKYRRLRYVRYADDFLLGFIGPKTEALEIKQQIGAFLSELGLSMSEDKTLVTHASEGSARFLGYEISIAQGNERRTANGSPRLRVPHDVAQAWKARYLNHNVACHRPELTDQSDYDIVMTYNAELQGLVNYYLLAHDVGRKLYPVKWVWMQSLVKTLAAKHKQKVSWVYRRYYRRSPEGIMALVVEVTREGREPLIARFGAKPIRHQKWAVVNDVKPAMRIPGNEVVKRLLAGQCELCGATEDTQVHHIRQLKELRRRYRGRKDPPAWVTKMAGLRRKTLVVCEHCHRAIHGGTYDGPRLT